MTSAPHILLYSGWQTCNIGDIGHTPGTLRLLEVHWPGARVAVWLAQSNPEIDAMLARRFPGVPQVRGGLAADGTASTPELQAALEACDLFVYNSGMIFNRFWPPPVALLEALIARRKRFGLFGQSFDGFAPGDEPAMRRLLSHATFIYCRDTESLAYLQQIGVAPPVLTFAPDGCFGIDVRDDGRARAYLDQHGLVAGEFIAVTLRTNTPKLAGAGDLLNPRQPTVDEQAQDARWAGLLREVIAAWVRTTGRRVLLAPEVDKEIAPAKRLLLDPLPADVRSRVVHRDTFWNVDEAASVYARAQAVVSMEPHSCIIALANGTPALHVFSRKHGVKAWMVRDIGLPEWLFDIDRADAGAVTRALLAVQAGAVSARDAVQRAMAFVADRQRAAVKGMVDA